MWSMYTNFPLYMMLKHGISKVQAKQTLDLQNKLCCYELFLSGYEQKSTDTYALKLNNGPARKKAKLGSTLSAIMMKP